MAIEEDKQSAGLSAPSGAAPERTGVRSDKFEVRIVPDSLEIGLRPRPAPEAEERHRSLWHHVLPRPGFLVSLTSLDEGDRVRLVRLAVRGDAPGWRAGWARWTFAVRAVSELLGGDAVSAQDVLSADGRELTLLLLPGERREATLEFDVPLEEQTRPGDLLFEVAATDAEDATGDGTVGRLRLRHPEPTLLNYLPAIYREARAPSDEPEQGSADLPFFQRFLLGFEDAQAPLRRMLDTMDRYFGANTTPPEFLPWLATWAALVLDENWPEMKRRRLIREAAELYRWRGTRRGLSRYLEIYAGVTPEINDRPFAGMRLGASTLLGRDATKREGTLLHGPLLGDVPVHTFVVTLAVPDVAAVNEQIVRDIIESEKPAHTGYALRIVRRAGEE